MRGKGGWGRELGERGEKEEQGRGERGAKNSGEERWKGIGVTPFYQTTPEVNNPFLDNMRLQIREEAHSQGWNASVWHCRPHQ